MESLILIWYILDPQVLYHGSYPFMSDHWSRSDLSWANHKRLGSFDFVVCDFRHNFRLWVAHLMDRSHGRRPHDRQQACLRSTGEAMGVFLGHLW